MTAAAVQLVCDDLVFQPRNKFAYLASDHVPMDVLTGKPNYESKILRAVVSEPICAAVIGPVGAGKSSLIADVCRQLPDTHVALRVPVVGVDDPTSTSQMAAMTLSTALGAVALEDYQRTALEGARADRVAGDRLAGLDRLVDILVVHKLQPVFVIEDTEAAVGGRDAPDEIARFFAGPVTAFVREIDAACLIAVQDHLAENEAFQALAPSLVRVEIPRFSDQNAVEVLGVILRHRLGLHDDAIELDHVFDGAAIDTLAAFYAETGSLRHALAAAQTAADHASEGGADLIAVGHMRAAVNEWRAD